MFDEKDQFVQTTIASHRKQKNFDIIKFKICTMSTLSKIYKGYSLRLQEDLNDLDDGEFYYHEIVVWKSMRVII